MKFVVRRRCAHKILEIANSAEAVQDGRMHIEKINAPFIYLKRESQLNTGGIRSSGGPRLAGAPRVRKSGSLEPVRPYSPDI